MHGPNLPALVEIGLTDLPKSGGGGREGRASPCPFSSDIPEFNIQGAKD